MPQGSIGGAKALGRVWRDAAFTVTGSPAQLAFDQDSVLLTPNNVTRIGGDIATGVRGAGIVLFSARSTGGALLTGIRILFVRSPGTAREATFVDWIQRTPASGAFTFGAGGAIDLEVGDTVQIQLEAQGTGTFSLTVADEIYTWAHLIIA